MKLILRFSPSCDLHQGEKELFNYLPQSTIQVEENDPFPLGVGGGLLLITPFTAAHTHIATPIPKKNSGRGGGQDITGNFYQQMLPICERGEMVTNA